MRDILCFEHSVGIEQAAIAGPERKFERSVRGVFRQPEQQAVGIDFAKGGLLAVHGSEQQRRVARSGIAQNPFLGIHEQVARGNEMFFELPAK